MGRIDCISNIFDQIVSVRANNMFPINKSESPSLISNSHSVDETVFKYQTVNTEKKKKQKKHLSNDDIKAIIDHKMESSNEQFAFPKSLYLVYQIVNGNDSQTNNVEMEILVEVDNMMQSYMLSELRAHSKKLLDYTMRNYSFLYLYTSPIDGQSAYKELDCNYESSVPAKNLIQHSSIGPVILVSMKHPTKEQIQKQKDKEMRIKRKRQRKT